jgi:hypothetical protein
MLVNNTSSVLEYERVGKPRRRYQVGTTLFWYTGMAGDCGVHPREGMRRTTVTEYFYE